MTIPTVSVNRLWFGIALACLVSGCINRPGMNAECRWPAEPSRSLDPRNVADVRHLRGDLEVADELVIRYRDEKGGRRARSVLGIQVRTGASGRPRDADAAECRGRLNASIANVHKVSCVTTVEAALAAAHGMAERAANPRSVRSLQEWLGA